MVLDGPPWIQGALPFARQGPRAAKKQDYVQNLIYVNKLPIQAGVPRRAGTRAAEHLPCRSLARAPAEDGENPFLTNRGDLFESSPSLS